MVTMIHFSATLKATLREEFRKRGLRSDTDQAAYEERVRACIRNGRSDVAEGRVIEGLEALDEKMIRS